MKGVISSVRHDNKRKNGWSSGDGDDGGGNIKNSKRSTEPAPGSNVRKRLDACGVKVERMPVGMSRQLRNYTKWHQR